jgi:ornithine cyclodeaminase
MTDVRILHAERIRALAPLTAEAIDLVADGFARLAAGEVRQPPVLSLDLHEVRGELDVKTAYVPGWESFCLKVSTGFFGNPDLGLPSASGLMILLSAQTGVPLALLLDGGYLTDLRTALAGAVAARELARADSTHAAIIGAGAQARWQLRALRLVRPIASASVWARSNAQAERFASEMTAETGLRIDVHDDVAQTVGGADVIVTTTPAREPLLTVEMLTSGVHVTAMGSDGVGKRELDPAVMLAADRVVVDEPGQSRTIGELQGVALPDVGGPEAAPLGDIVAGRRGGRRSDDDVTVCDLTGTGVQDTVIARWVWHRSSQPQP